MPEATEEAAAVLHVLHAELTLRNSAALTQTISDLIASGRLPVGTQLPTVRELAEEVGMSRSAVGQAWRTLSARGLVETGGRAGTRVLGRGDPPHARRYESMVRSSISSELDLGNLRSETVGYPNLNRALEHALSTPSLHNVFVEPISEELQNAVTATWPFQGSSFLATHGLIDALELALSATVSRGDKVIVESPTQGRVYDILEAMDAIPIPVPYRPEGPDIAELRKALISKPVAFVYQPQGSTPSGRSVTRAWIQEAAGVLQGTIPVIELGQFPLLYDEALSLGSNLPEQVVNLQAYNFFFGADLRVGVAGGSKDLLNTMWMRLTYSSRFVTRLLQATLAHLLTDQTAQAQSASFVGEVKLRHLRLQQALVSQGLAVETTEGPSIWLEVPDEHSVCTRLSQAGIVVYPGRFFLPNGVREQRIHICSTNLSSGFEEVAAQIADACEVPSSWR